MRAFALLLLVAAAAPLGCRCGDARSAKGKEAPKAVALVNGEPVTATALQRELHQARAHGGDGEAPVDLLRKRVLEDLVDRAVLLQQARARQVVVGQDQVERAFLRLRAEYPGTHFDDLMAQERLSAAELKSRLRDQLTVEKLFRDEVFPGVDATDEEVRRYHAEHPEEFEVPERVRASQVVLKTRDEAQKVRAELLRRPASFAEVARRASIAPEGKQGGDLGFFGKGSMPEVFDVCFRLPLNAVSEVTPSPYGFHVFKVVERRPAGKRSLEDARGEIRERLLREKRARAQEEYLVALKRRAKVSIDEAALASVTY
jgi:parvulin-like peptidyl-prolyl isomerase